MAASLRPSFDFSTNPLDSVAFRDTTVLARAIESEAPGQTRCLLKRCDPNAPIGKESIRPLMVASYVSNEHKRLAIFKDLIECGADPSLTDVYGRNSMMYACALSLWKEVRLMIQDSDRDLSATDMNGDTLLHMCAKAGGVQVLGIVLQEMQRYRLNISMQNNRYLTPLSLAILSGYRDCALMLHEAGGCPRYPKSKFQLLLSDMQEHSQKHVNGYTRQHSSKAISHIHEVRIDSQRVKYLNRPKRPSTTFVTEKERRSKLPLLTGSEYANNFAQLHTRVTKSAPSDQEMALKRKRSEINFSAWKYSAPQVREPPDQDERRTCSHVRHATSMDCINALLSSPMLRARITSLFCKPSKCTVNIDSHWLATVNEYEQKRESCDEYVSVCKEQSHPSFSPMNLRRKQASSSSSTPSSGSSVQMNQQNMFRWQKLMKHNSTTPQLFNKAQKHEVCPV